MQINVFEGARRLAVLAALLAIIGAVALGASVTSYTSGNYRLYAPGAKLIATPKRCDEPGSRYSYFTTDTPKGRSAGIALCYVSMPFVQPDGSVRHLVPYLREPDGRFWGAGNYSPEVERYVEETQRGFRIPSDEGNKLDDQYEQRRNSEWRAIGIGLAIFLAVFWFGVVAIGWIVRGFAGIPRGRDARPKHENKQ